MDLCIVDNQAIKKHNVVHYMFPLSLFLSLLRKIYCLFSIISTIFSLVFHPIVFSFIAEMSKLLIWSENTYKQKKNQKGRGE
jgi:hypothetical protein